MEVYTFHAAAASLLSIFLERIEHVEAHEREQQGGDATENISDLRVWAASPCARVDIHPRRARRACTACDKECARSKKAVRSVCRQFTRLGQRGAHRGVANLAENYLESL